jgi:hypothetical protein
MQINASVGGECVSDAALESKKCRTPNSRLGETIMANETDVAFTL